jgi:Bacteriophage head to tail connecting protein
MPSVANQTEASRLLSAGSGANSSKAGNFTVRTLADEIIKRQRRFEAQRAAQDSLWDDVDKYVTSRRAKYNIGTRTGETPKEPVSSAIYDNTAGLALQTFTDGFQSQTASPLIDWWAARFRGILKKDVVGLKWMDETKEAILFELSRSPFYEHYNECIGDATSHGVATMAGPEWDDKKLRLGFRTHHPREIFCAFDTQGNVTIWHHKFLLTGRQIVTEFPNARLSDKTRNRIKNNEFIEFVVVHAIYENHETAGQSQASTDKKWRSIWVLEQDKAIPWASGYDTNPMDTWTWRNGGWGLYATCPAIDALYDVIMTNAAAKSLLNAVQLSVLPPLLLTEGVKGNVNFFPGGQTILHSPQDKVSAFQFPTNFMIGVEQINEMHKEIVGKFRADLFSLLSSMPHQMPVVQSMGIQGEKVSMLIPLITRASSSMLIPKVNKTFIALAKAGRLPKPPQSIMRYAHSPVDIEMLGPLATAAKRFLNQQGFQAMMAQLAEISKIVPPPFYQAITEGFNPDEIRKYLMDSNSAPQRIVLDEDQLAMLRKNKAQLAMEARRAQMMKTLSDAYGKSTQAPDPGSAAEQAMNQ